MAVIFVGATLIICVASSNHAPTAPDRMAADETKIEMEYVGMIMNNTMPDGYSLYVYLADSDAEWDYNNFNQLEKE